MKHTRILKGRKMKDRNRKTTVTLLTALLLSSHFVQSGPGVAEGVEADVGFVHQREE
jgi:hypothetical protein